MPRMIEKYNPKRINWKAIVSVAKGFYDQNEAYVYVYKPKNAGIRINRNFNA